VRSEHPTGNAPAPGDPPTDPARALDELEEKILGDRREHNRDEHNRDEPDTEHQPADETGHGGREHPG
jgi:hypothetical protein